MRFYFIVISLLLTPTLVQSQVPGNDNLADLPQVRTADDSANTAERNKVLRSDQDSACVILPIACTPPPGIPSIGGSPGGINAIQLPDAAIRLQGTGAFGSIQNNPMLQSEQR